jgi:hypothetical protein
MGSYDRLPLPLSARLASATKNIFSPQGREYDVSIGGIPFRLATYNEIPQSVETVSIRRDQVDTEQDPGEQSLTSWWRRSQSSFHEGAGSLYQENSSQVVDSTSFYDSSGVDVFTPGQIKLLKKMKSWTAPTGATRMRTFAANSVRTNLSNNPNFETSAANWTTTTGGGPVGDLPTIARTTSKFHSGAASGLVTWGTDDATGLPPGIGIAVPTLTASAVVTTSVWVWVPTGSPHVTLIGPGVTGTFSTANDTWQRLSVTSTTNGSGVANVFLWPKTPTSAGLTFYVDDLLVEYGTTVGSYFDGSSLNSAWAGTTNLSQSTETIVASGVSVSEVAGGQLYTAPTVAGTFASLHAPVGKTIVDGLVASGFFYDIASDGTLYQGTVSSPGTATTWPLGSTPSRLLWGKHRLWVIGANKLWQPNLSLAGGTSQSPIFTHPNQGWTYTCMAEGSSAMLFGGHDGFASTIQSITLDSGGGLPTLSGAAVTAALPDGELVQELSVLAGQYVGIGTNRGFRVGTISSNGQITYGPLIIEPEGISACTALTAQGRYFVVGFRTTAGTALVYRVDTGTALEGGVFPYAKDIDCGFIGAVTSLAAPSGSQLVCISSDGSSWYQSTTEYVDSGYLQTGRIRYRTTEPKNFKALSVEIEPLAGAISCSLIQEGGTTAALGNITATGEVFSESFVHDGDPMRYASVKFTMTPGGGGITTPTIHSYQLRALPAVPPQRLITLPLMCYDQERANSGQMYGGSGFAVDRLTALQLIEDAADTVLYQDFTGPNSSGQLVTIESLKFVQTVAASTSTTSQKTGPGGILIAQLRTI